MVSNGFSIADPAMLDVVGFDMATPQLISDFARGALCRLTTEPRSPRLLVRMCRNWWTHRS
jgi:hypothetical protein